jgi:hypothetical protein
MEKHIATEIFIDSYDEMLKEEREKASKVNDNLKSLKEKREAKIARDLKLAEIGKKLEEKRKLREDKKQIEEKVEPILKEEKEEVKSKVSAAEVDAILKKRKKKKLNLKSLKKK